MFAKLFNLFRKKPSPIQDEVPPTPSPVKKTVSTSPCCGGCCSPSNRERPQKSKRELKPVIKRDDIPVYIGDDIIVNSVIRGTVANYPEEHKSSPVETTNDSDPCEYGGCDCD